MCQNLHLYLYQHDDDKSHTPRDPELKPISAVVFPYFDYLKELVLG